MLAFYLPMTRELFIKSPGPICESEEVRPLFTAISYLRYSGIFRFVQSDFTHAIHNPDDGLNDIYHAAQKAIGELEKVAGFWSASHNINPDFDANYFTNNPDTEVALKKRNGLIRHEWRYKQNTEKRNKMDAEFFDFYEAARTIEPGTFGYTQATEYYYTQFNELWNMLISPQVTDVIIEIAQKNGDLYENTLLQAAKMSFIFCKMVDEKQKETNGAFIPQPDFRDEPILVEFSK